jgi:hypothetical protein
VQIATAQDVDPVEVTASAAGDAVPGGVLTATAEVTINDGSTISGYAWMQTSGVPAAVMGADTATAMVTLGSRHEYKDALIEILKEPPIGEDDLPPNVPPPEGEFPGGLQDRYQVVGLNPFSLEEAGLVVLKVTVTTTSGSYSDEVEVHTGLPWKVSTGLENVPAGRTVLLYGKDQADGYDWTLMGPGASSRTSRACTPSRRTCREPPSSSTPARGGGSSSARTRTGDPSRTAPAQAVTTLRASPPPIYSPPGRRRGTRRSSPTA